DPIDMISELTAMHEKGQIWAGIDAFSGEIKDMWELNVLEPLKVKKQIIKSATEAACMILKIDDVIAASRLKEKEKESTKSSEEGFGGGEF
ncbi:MAG TPA: thermosome subunit, partial [Candidatus Bathyarchaeota archaeon]|nr:thermosome subunit [Candidatus Bathyarchaeota archaeon]